MDSIRKELNFKGKKRGRDEKKEKYNNTSGGRR